MTGRRGKDKTIFRFTRSVLTCSIVISVGLIYSPSWGQTSDQVTVDLSVLNDGGVRSPSALPTFAGGGTLLVPPTKVPVSQLHIAPAAAPKLVRPTPKKASMPKPVSAPKKVARSETKKIEMPTPVAPPAPAPAPAPKAGVSTAPPPPAPKKAETVAEKTAAPPPPAPEPPTTSMAPPPPPTVAKAPEPAEVPKAVAAANAGIEIQPGLAARVKFSETATKIPGESKDRLRALAEGVRDRADLRLQLMAFAGAEGLSASKARRMSLSRALSVRSFLIENGVRSTRIDVRALGNKTSEKPANRVDINIAKR